MSRLCFAGAACVLCLLHVGAHAQPSEAEQRSSIRQQRQVAEAQYTQRKADCAQVFAVVACEDQARNEHRREMRRLREQELVLDDSKRQRRAQAKTERMGAKAESASAGSGTVFEPAIAPVAPSASEPAPLKHAKAERAPARAPATSAQLKRQRFEERQRSAQAHREKVAQRNAERADRKAKPLPAPPGASDVKPAL